MKARVIASEQADLDVVEEHAWWQEHRADSPGLFLDELADAYTLLAEQPLAGIACTLAEGRIVRRLILKRTRHHVYYEYQPAHGCVVVHSVWGAVKLRQPQIGKSRSR